MDSESTSPRTGTGPSLSPSSPVGPNLNIVPFGASGSSQADASSMLAPYGGTLEGFKDAIVRELMQKLSTDREVVDGVARMVVDSEVMREAIQQRVEEVSQPLHTSIAGLTTKLDQLDISTGGRFSSIEQEMQRHSSNLNRLSTSSERNNMLSQSILDRLETFVSPNVSSSPSLPPNTLQSSSSHGDPTPLPVQEHDVITSAPSSVVDSTTLATSPLAPPTPVLPHPEVGETLSTLPEKDELSLLQGPALILPGMYSHFSGAIKPH